jgi:threonine aldolase
MKIIDLRSDTVTLPTQEMLQAILHAPLGDDVYSEDPTVNKLQQLAAEKMGMEKALLVTSGTQGNLASILSHTKKGDEVILEASAHTYRTEAGGLCIVGGLIPNPIQGTMGVLDPRDVERSIRPRNVHYPEPTLIAIENTHNAAGGTCWNPSQIKAIKEVAERHGMRVHMDGARVFNAAIALNVGVKELTKHVDSVTFCLSKGLSAPIGALVVGDEAFIDRARKWRKVLGGGLRQAGVIAAPGIIALEKMVDRLKEDHANARTLAEGLARIPGVSINLDTVQTNIVRYGIAGLGMDASQFVSKLRKHGILTGGSGTRIRMVTHRMISRENIDYTLSTIEAMTKPQETHRSHQQPQTT